MKRYTPERIVTMLREAETSGETIAGFCRRKGISEVSFYRWRAKYGGLDQSEAKRLKALEAENAKLKKLLAEAMLANDVLKEVVQKSDHTGGPSSGDWTDDADGLGRTSRQSVESVVQTRGAV